MRTLRRLGVGLALVSIVGVGAGTGTTVRNPGPGPRPVRQFTTVITRARVGPVVGTASFSFVATGLLASSFTCDLSGILVPSGTLTTPPSTCLSGRHYRHLSVGEYTFSVYAVDAGGNHSFTAYRSFTINYGCPPGQTVQSLAGGTSVDSDGDETGAPNDGDGCI
jgi:hypothetical protein